MHGEPAPLLQLPLAKVPARRLARIPDWSQSHGNLHGQCSWLLVAAGSPGTRRQSCCSLLQLTVLPSLAQVRASTGPAQLSGGLGAEDGTPIPQVLPEESF